MHATTASRFGRVFVAHHDAQTARRACQELNAAGYRSEWAVNGQDTLTALHASPPDLLLLDPQITSPASLEIVRHLKAGFPQMDGLLLITLENQTMSQEGVQSIEAGADGCLFGPLTGAAFMSQIHTFHHLHQLCADWKGRAVASELQKQDLARQRGTDQQALAQLQTAQRQAEADQEKLREQLAQAQKLESIGRLAGGIAHDFNNMLQAILGNLSLALEDLPADSPVRESLLEVEAAAQRSAELTRQLLAFARKQTISPHVLDLNETVSGMLKMLSRLIGEQIELVWKPAPHLWPVCMDPGQLNQILANLCVNARDAIVSHGCVTIETANFTLDATYTATHAEVVPGDNVMMAVTDNGKGMDPYTKEHLLEPFFTTKAPGHGTGLGLATVFGIVKQNHGLINVYSEPDQGATFKIYLPRSQSHGAASTSDNSPNLRRGTETILLVEDENQVLTLAQRILSQYGYTVLAASSPEKALLLAADHPGTIHLLITDVIMPNMNGREVYKTLSAARPGLRCLYISGYTANVIAHQGILEPGVHFIEKPFTVHSLMHNVAQAFSNPISA